MPRSLSVTPSRRTPSCIGYWPSRPVTDRSITSSKSSGSRTWDQAISSPPEYWAGGYRRRALPLFPARGSATPRPCCRLVAFSVVSRSACAAWERSHELPPSLEPSLALLGAKSNKVGEQQNEADEGGHEVQPESRPGEPLPLG